MTDQRPPDRVVRGLNPVVRALLRSPAGRLIGGLGLLEFDGRRTHRRYRVVVGCHRLDGETVVFTPAPWRSNFTSGATATVLHRGQRQTLTGTLDTDPARVANALGRLIDSGTSPRALGLNVPAGHSITATDVETIDRAMIRFSDENPNRVPDWR